MMESIHKFIPGHPLKDSSPAGGQLKGFMHLTDLYQINCMTHHESAEGVLANQLRDC